MPLYRVVSRGENFLLNFTGEPELLGFRATHYVKADSEEDAMRTAAILVRKDSRLNRSVMNPRQNPNRLECESIQRVWWRRANQHGRIHFWSMEPETGPATREASG